MALRVRRKKRDPNRPSTANEEIEDLYIIRGAHIERAKARIARDSVGFVNEFTIPSVTAALGTYIVRIKDRGSIAKIRKLLAYKEFRERVQDVFAETRRGLNSRLRRTSGEIARQQAIFYEKSLVKLLRDTPIKAKSPTIGSVTSKGFGQPFGDTSRFVVFPEHMKLIESGMLRSTISTVDLGLVQGLSTDQIISRVVGRNGKAKQFRQSAFRISKNITQHMANMAILAGSTENPKIIRFERWSSVLDKRTTDICISLDGTVWKIGDGPYPPVHHLCRSWRVPQLLSARQMGLRRGDLPEERRLALDGTIPERMVGSEWLRIQPIEVQNEILGVKKSRAWREGKLDPGLSPSQLLSADLRPLTLVELEEKLGIMF